MMWNWSLGLQTLPFQVSITTPSGEVKTQESDVFFERELMGLWSNLRAKRCSWLMEDDGSKSCATFFLKSNENIGHSQYQLVSGISEPSTVLCSVSLNVNPFVLLLRWIPEMSCWCFNFGDSDLMVDVSWKDEIFTELMPECHGWAQFWKV